MRKSLLTIFVILLSAASSFGASASGRVKMTVVRTNVQPAAVKILKDQKQQIALVEVIY
jgi:hypothetical protein